MVFCETLLQISYVSHRVHSITNLSKQTQIKQNIAWEFSRHRHLTSPVTTKEQLLKAHRVGLSIINPAAFAHTCTSGRISLLRQKRGTYAFKQFYGGIQVCWKLSETKTCGRLLFGRSWYADHRALTFHARVRLGFSVSQHEIRSKSRPTGAFFAPTLYNRPLPMLKPQPINLTGIINRRRRSRIIRQQHLDNIVELREDLKKECAFETMVEKYEGAQINKVITHSVGQMCMFAVYVQHSICSLCSGHRPLPGEETD